ncbi:hypothetical protein F4677DRAFT_129532 [Hypoxylon crocopeplum]|nr:hypothetical protein F4677DRAFT_129532 [Hypoxylon crocopeplum]
MANTRPPCLVCSTVEGKYKCPRCNLFTCSVPCFREHRDNHPTVEPLTTQQPKDTTVASRNDVNSYNDSSHTQESAGIADMPEYKALVQKYPNLEGLLWNIAAATDPPASNANAPTKNGALPGSNRGHHKTNQPWTKDIGYENGVKMLRRTRATPGNDRDALKEYSELVRLYLSRRESANIAANTRQQFAQDDVKAIGELMRAEGAGAP